MLYLIYPLIYYQSVPCSSHLGMALKCCVTENTVHFCILYLIQYFQPQSSLPLFSVGFLLSREHLWTSLFLSRCSQSARESTSQSSGHKEGSAYSAGEHLRFKEGIFQTLFTTARINYPLPLHTYLPPSKGIITEDKALGERSQGGGDRPEGGGSTGNRDVGAGKRAHQRSAHSKHTHTNTHAG